MQIYTALQKKTLTYTQEGQNSVEKLFRIQVLFVVALFCALVVKYYVVTTILAQKWEVNKHNNSLMQAVPTGGFSGLNEKNNNDDTQGCLTLGLC